MSIIQQIREKYAAIGFGLIALSLIAFILMDAGKRGSGGSRVSGGDAIGEVNGVNISYEKFLDKTKQTEQMYESNGRVVDENTRQQINSDTWRTMLEKELLTQELDKLGLKVTDKEYNDLLFGKNPPDFLKQEFTNKETGEFDAASAKQAISELKKAKSNPNKTLVENFYLAPLLENTLKKKYNALLQNSAYVPKWMAEKAIADNNAIASFSYVTLPYNSIPDSTIKISDEQINAYVEAHKREFKQEEDIRTISYVSFPFTPSTDDSAAGLQSLLALKEEFKTTADPGTFVTRNASTLPFYDGYNSKSRIQIPQKDSIIAAGVGNIYGPYIDGNNYVLSRVVDVKTMPDSVKAHHILVSLNDMNTRQPKLSDSAAKKKIDSIEALIKGGANFELLAMQLSDDPGSKLKGGDLDYFASGAMVKEFNDFCFEKKKGDMGSVKTSYGYHLIRIDDQKNFEPSYKIAYLSKAIEPSQTTINDALGKANLFAGNSRNSKAFDENVIKDKYKKDSGVDVKENDYSIPALGVNRKVVREIFDKDPGDVLDPEEFDNQYVVITVTGSNKAGVLSAAKARPQVENILRNQEKAKQLIAKIGTPASLEAATQSLKVTAQRADSISFASPNLPGAGFEPKIGGYAFFKGNMNKLSQPASGVSGVFLVKVDAVGAKVGENSNPEDMQRTLASQQKGTIMYSSTQAMRNAAKINDKRSKFL